MAGLSPDQRKLIEEVAGRFVETGEWPTLGEIEGRLKSKLDILQVLAEIPEEFGMRIGYIARDQRLSLTLSGFAETSVGRDQLPRFLAVVRLAARRYIEGGMPPQITSEDVQRELGIPIPQSRFLKEMLWTFGHFSGSGGMKADGPWYTGLHPAARYFLDVHSLEDFEAAQKVAAERERTLRDSRSILGKREEIIESPALPAVKRNTAFIIMRMTKDAWSKDVHQVVKETFEEFDIKAYRADDVEHSDKITDLVLRSIQEAEFLIADLTGERPNVYYEVGYAHAIGKRPILFRRKGTSLHFDLSVHNIPELESVLEVRSWLRKRLSEVTGKEPRKSL